MKLFLTLFISLLTTNLVTLLAYQTQDLGYIILKDGTRETGTINISELEDEGVVIFQKENSQSQLFGASDLSGFSVNGKKLIRSLEIEYSVTNSRDSVAFFFAERIFEGPIHLEKVYATIFEYAITKQENTTALQRIQNENENVNRYFDRYKGVLYLAFRDCQKAITTDNISFTEEAFLDVLKQYWACKDTDYYYQKTMKNWRVSFGLGRNNTQLDFTVFSQNRFIEDNFVSNYKNSSELNFQVGLERMLYKEMIFASLGIGYQRYNFVHENSEDQRNVGKLEYSEIILGLSIDFKYPNKYIIPILGAGYQYHNIGNGAEGLIRGELYTTNTFNGNQTYTTYTLKPVNEERQDYATPFFYMGLSRSIHMRIDLGAKIKWTFRTGEYFTKDYDQSDDKLSDEINFSLFMLVRL